MRKKKSVSLIFHRTTPPSLASRDYTTRGEKTGCPAKNRCIHGMRAGNKYFCGPPLKISTSSARSTLVATFAFTFSCSEKCMCGHLGEPEDAAATAPSRRLSTAIGGKEKVPREAVDKPKRANVLVKPFTEQLEDKRETTASFPSTLRRNKPCGQQVNQKHCFSLTSTK